MKLATRFIYYKAAASPIYTLDMPKEDWSVFFCATPAVQKKMLCELAGRHPDEWLNRIRVATGIPLSDQYEVIEVKS